MEGKGNRITNGFLIEYFANPVEEVKRTFRKEFTENKRNTARMFAIGIPIYDEGPLSDIIKEAKLWLKKKFEPKTKEWVELEKYTIYTGLSKLRSVKKSILT